MSLRSAGGGGQLIVTDLAVNSSFRVVAVYALDDRTERVSFSGQLGPFLVDPACLV